MMLGIVLHGANPYRPGSAWLVTDPSTWAGFTILVEVIHRFRMPAFFVVAGFFGAFSLSRRPVRAFLAERMTRLLVPCLATLMTFNLIQLFALAPRPITIDSLVEFAVQSWQSGRGIAHLWFLLVLACHCILLAACARLWHHAAELPDPTTRYPRGAVGGLVLCGIVLGVGGRVIGALGPGWMHGYVGGLINPMEVLEYLPFFVAGLALHGRMQLLRAFASPGVGALAAAGLAVAGLTWSEGIAGRPAQMVSAAAGLTLTWTAVRACFWVFRMLTDRHSPTFRYLSDASYSIYLAHHLLVIMTAGLLVGLPWHAGWKFLVVVTVTTIAALLFHELAVRRSEILTLLFNGKRRKPVTP